MSVRRSFPIWSACLGNLFEHYDTALFALLSPILAGQFFPNHDPLSALILTYAIIPLGMLVRPLGSLLFGYIGDKHGRKRALASSLIGMAIVTAGMGLLPGYSDVGTLAPILLSLGKLLQSFFAAGETVGGAIYVIERSDSKSHNLISSLYDASTVGGIILASLGVSVLASRDLLENNWRILYFLGCSTACFGVILRLTNSFEKPQEGLIEKYSVTTMLKTFWEMRLTLLTIAMAAGFSYACYSVAFVMINGLVPLVSAVTTKEVMHLNTVLLVFDLLCLPLFGLLANRVSREKLMLAASTAAIIFGMPLFLLLEGAALPVVTGVRLCFVIIGVAFSATFYAWSQQLVPSQYRSSAIGVACALGSQLLGGPTAAVSLWCYQQTGAVAAASWYWLLLAGLCGLLILRKFLLVETTSGKSFGQR